METVEIKLNPNSVDDYRMFIEAKKLPRCDVRGRTLIVPAEYAGRLGLKAQKPRHALKYKPEPWLFDYQRDITALAIRRQKFAVFANCGLGKTAIVLEFARHAHASTHGKILIVSPLMVVRQTIAECQRFYGDAMHVERIEAARLQSWLDSDGDAIGITNYDAIRDGLTPGRLSGLILDESSILKSAYGTWGTRLIDLGRGLTWKLCCTGTPAPNDRIEYANHAVFLDSVPTANAFLARFFVNRGQTDNRWELKPHALRPFYRALSDWCIFLNDPSVYGWKDNCGTIPPINVHIEHVDATPEQEAILRRLAGGLFATKTGGFTDRSKWSQLAKGWASSDDGRIVDVATNKYDAIRRLTDSWPDESALIWCWFNREQGRLQAEFPGAASIAGETKQHDRERLLDEFIDRKRRLLISKPDVLGLGLNLQVATRQVFSSLIDSYESYFQCIKRSNRIGSTMELNVHIPLLDIERPMVDNVLRKAARVDADTKEQEEIFREHWHG